MQCSTPGLTQKQLQHFSFCTTSCACSNRASQTDVINSTAFDASHLRRCACSAPWPEAAHTRPAPPVQRLWRFWPTRCTRQARGTWRAWPSWRVDVAPTGTCAVHASSDMDATAARSQHAAATSHHACVVELSVWLGHIRGRRHKRHARRYKSYK